MKNREKFRDEIVKYARTTSVRNNLCEFIEKNMLPHFGEGGCDGVNCNWCRVLLDMWLDEEYIEPKSEVDWSKMPVDTLVRVKDEGDDEWRLRYFSGYYEDTKDYETFYFGATSTTSQGAHECWDYCELAEDKNV